jgi:hypothetical protein
MDAFSFLSGRIKSLRLSKGARIVCLVGRIWVTIEGDPRDYVLNPGDDFVSSGGSLIVMEDLSESEVGSYYAVRETAEEGGRFLKLPEFQNRPDFDRA